MNTQIQSAGQQSFESKVQFFYDLREQAGDEDVETETAADRYLKGLEPDWWAELTARTRAIAAKIEEFGKTSSSGSRERRPHEYDELLERLEVIGDLLAAFEDGVDEEIR